MRDARDLMVAEIEPISTPFEHPEPPSIYAIRQISTGRYLLARNRVRGGTKEDPEPWRAGHRGARTFGCLSTARKALSAWLKGDWFMKEVGDPTNFDYDLVLRTNPRPDRNPADMEIVEFRLIEVERHGHAGTPKPPKKPKGAPLSEQTQTDASRSLHG